MAKRFPTLTDKTLVDLRNESARVARAAAMAMDDDKYERMMNVVNHINEILIDRAKAKDEPSRSVGSCRFFEKQEGGVSCMEKHKA